MGGTNRDRIGLNTCLLPVVKVRHSVALPEQRLRPVARDESEELKPANSLLTPAVGELP